MRMRAFSLCHLLSVGLLLGCGDDPGRPVRYLYLITNPDGPNAIEGFRIDPDSGELTPLGRTATGGRGEAFVGGFSQHTIVNDGQHLYAVNPGSDEVSALRIEDDGSLHLLGVVPSSGRRPLSLALDRGRLFVANAGNVPLGDEPLPGSYSAFAVDADGSLRPIAGSSLATPIGSSPSDIVASAGGRLIAAWLGGNVLDSLSVTTDGTLVQQGQLDGQPGPLGILFSPTDPDLLFATLANPDAGPPAPGVASYSLGPEGSLTLKSVVTDTEQKDPCWLAASPDGRRLWVSAFKPRTLTLYSVDADGELSYEGDYQPEDDNTIGSSDIALDPEGQFLYQLRAFDVESLGQVPIRPELRVFAVAPDADHADLHLVQSVVLPADLDMAGVMGLTIAEP